MDNFGDLLGGLGEMLFGGGTESGIDGVGDAVEGGLSALGFGGGKDEGSGAAAAVDRYLTGAPRVLHINDR